MADIKISQLGAAIAVNDSDLLPIVSNGSTLKAPASLVKEYAVGDTDLTGIGDGTPTGAISALNTAKQPKTLDTPLTIGGVQKTTVEAALDGLNSESQSLNSALTNVEDDLSTITRTGTSNSGTKLNKETFFYLNGDLVQAIADINNGDSFASNTNYKDVSSGDGVLNQIGTTDNSAFSVTAKNNAVVVNSVFKQRNGVIACHLDVNFANVNLNTEVNILTIYGLVIQGYSKSGLYTTGVILSRDNSSQIGTFILASGDIYARVSQAIEGVFSFVLVKE